MKKIITYILLATMLVLQVSCLDKFPENAVPEGSAITTVDEADQAVVGIYSSFLSGALYSGYLTLLPDIQCDMVYAVNGYTNTFGDVWRWEILATNAQIEAVYGSLYSVIGNCNFLLDNAAKLKPTLTNDTELDRLEMYCGEAYFARALAYSELIKLYCVDYKSDDEAKNEEEDKMSQEELLMLVEEVEQEGTIDKNESNLLRNAIEFTERRADDILTHRMDLEAVAIDDTIGCLLETQEGFDKKKADLLRTCLLTIQKKGLAGMNPADMAKMGYAMMKYGMKYEDAVKLYGKYIGNWGGEATLWRLIAVTDGLVAATYTCGPGSRLHLEVLPSHTHLQEGATYDMASVRIRILDEHGNIAPYAQLPVQLTLEGDAELVGPAVVTAEGGMTGTYIKTTGKTGEAKLTITTDQTEPVILIFKITV